MHRIDNDGAARLSRGVRNVCPAVSSAMRTSVRRLVIVDAPIDLCKANAEPIGFIRQRDVVVKDLGAAR